MYYTGYEIQKSIAQEGSQTDAFKIYYSKEAKEIKDNYSKALELEKKDIRRAVKLFEKVIDDCNDIKEKVYNLGGYDDNSLMRLLSFINPLLLLIADQEIDGSYNKYKGTFDVKSMTTYDDEYSLTAPNEVQAQVQRAFNIILANSKQHLATLTPYVNGRMIKTTVKIK